MATKASLPRLEASMTCRGDRRSVRAPPNNMNTARGTATRASTEPVAKALPVNCRTSQGRATA
ncbi:MAG: hypothetical protein BWY79_02113 [Actinobacteria bacterium ADurb.Bin444]|nr:MAG: hypothetical protein BWY79_02113 [Actinobacteria bacterium ADurb.Bin444]